MENCEKVCFLSILPPWRYLQQVYHSWRISWHLEARNCDTNSKSVSSRLWGPSVEIILHNKFLKNLWKHFGWISDRGYKIYQWPLSIWKLKGHFCATLSCQNVRQDPCHVRYQQSERGLCCYHEYGKLEQSIWPTMPETWGTNIYKKWCSKTVKCKWNGKDCCLQQETCRGRPTGIDEI